MKSTIFSSILFCMLVSTYAQQNIQVDSKEYHQLKSSGEISSYKVSSTTSDIITPVTKSLERSGGACNCLIDVDGSFTIALPASDDMSSGMIPLPFSFCFYGNTIDSLWINNNGNITFDNPYSTFSAVGFPSANYSMIAPFWGDVDTRGAGTVYYKITPWAVIIKWEGVGYFSSHDSLLNTFQLIITDGTDPLVPGGNISFCYGDMQWTTGDASSGVGGFGGVAATVGVNKGDGIDYMQVGRFNVDDTIFDGSYGANDGVHFLDDKWVVMNSCISNIPPIGLGDPCDTVVLMLGQTIDEKLYFLAPEIDQITSIILPSNPGFNLVNTNTGSTTIVDYQFTGTMANIGYNTLHFTAIDDGSPADTTHMSVVYLVVDNTGINENADDQFVIYPNPANNICYIDFKNTQTELPVQIKLSNIYGQQVFAINDIKVANGPYALHLDNISNGIYFVTVSLGDKAVTNKIFVER